MNDLTPGIGHNFPPDPIDTATAAHDDVRAEAENWLDGTLVENERQMNAVDVLIKAMKLAAKEIDAARDSDTKPLHEAWKSAIERWKPTQLDYDRIVKGLIAVVDPFKRRLLAEKESAAKEAQRVAWEATRAAELASRAAQSHDIEAIRAAAEVQAQAELAQAQANAAAKDNVTGMRKVWKFAVRDHKTLLNWIAKNDRDAVTAFIEEYARQNHKTLPAESGCDAWQERVAA